MREGVDRSRHAGGTGPGAGAFAGDVDRREAGDEAEPERAGVAVEARPDATPRLYNGGGDRGSRRVGEAAVAEQILSLAEGALSNSMQTAVPISAGSSRLICVFSPACWHCSVFYGEYEKNQHLV